MTLRLNYISFLVTDMERSLAFYRTLGLPIPPGAHLNDAAEVQGHVEITQNGLRIAWESEAMMQELNPDWKRPASRGRLSSALEADSVAAVNATCERVAAAGYKVLVPPFDAPWGQRYATLTDPDGTALDVFAWLPGQS